MPSPRLNASLEAAGMIRRAEAEGGFGAVLRKGDAERGALLLVIRNRDRHVTCLERALSAGGGYQWTKVGPGAEEAAESLDDYVSRRVRFDQDLWLIELDIAQPERFIAETTSAG